eukprot:366128-Chlamydomonas_euryale.AAC.9
MLSAPLKCLVGNDAPNFDIPIFRLSTVCGMSRTVHTVRAGEALGLPPVLLRVPQYHICLAPCGFHTTDRVPPYRRRKQHHGEPALGAFFSC